MTLKEGETQRLAFGHRLPCLDPFGNQLGASCPRQVSKLRPTGGEVSVVDLHKVREIEEFDLIASADEIVNRHLEALGAQVLQASGEVVVGKRGLKHFDDHPPRITVEILTGQQESASEVHKGGGGGSDVSSPMERRSDHVLGGPILLGRIPQVDAKPGAARSAEQQFIGGK